MASCRSSNLALLVSVGEDLEAVGGDGEELDVGACEQRHHLLQTSSQTHRVLGAFLMQQQVVEGCDSVEEDGLHGRATTTHTRDTVKKK